MATIAQYSAPSIATLKGIITLVCHRVGTVKGPFQG